MLTANQTLWTVCLSSNEILESAFEAPLRTLARRQSLIKQEISQPVHLTWSTPQTHDKRERWIEWSAGWRQMPLVSNGEVEVRGRESITHRSLTSRQKITFLEMLNFYECQCQMKVITVAYIRQKDRKRQRKWYLHCLVDDSGFLQQVLRYLRSDHSSPAGELHLQVLPEAAGVVVDDGAGVSECFHQAVDQQDLLLERPVIGLDKTLFQLSNWETSVVEVIIILSRISYFHQKWHHHCLFYSPTMKRVNWNGSFFFNVVANPDWHQLEAQINSSQDVQIASRVCFFLKLTLILTVGWRGRLSIQDTVVAQITNCQTISSKRCPKMVWDSFILII